MFAKKLLTGILALSLAVPAVPGSLLNAADAKAAEAPAEIVIDKTDVSNPITNAKDSDGSLIYGGDPAVLVDGDTVYLYTGHDVSVNEGYNITEWLCYTSKDLKTWNYEGPIMGADKNSITWTSSGTDAWAAQVAKYKDKYYLYYCTWDATSSGKQSIGVAVSDSPTGPFKDKGEPLVKGTVTTPETSGWNDIDPTVWIETDDKGVEHRYLAWGNGKFYICELNEDMMNVKDQNGDDKITQGTSIANSDIVGSDGVAQGLDLFTEAPWLYRRTGADGKPTGKYYLFYAYGFREQMAYATADDLMSGKWTFGKVLMPPTATSDTNHMAVFDFKGETYFIYHNGSQPAGSGHRRTVCITKLEFNDDGSIKEIPETAIGITGAKASKLYAGSGFALSHENFTNSSVDADYPYTDIRVGTYPKVTDDKDADWAIVAGKADPSKDSYVSIQSENKPGLYLTVNDDKSVTLAQDWDQAKIAETAKKQTFKTVKALNGNEKGVSFESVSNPGSYLSLETGSTGSLVLTDGADKESATFYIDANPKDSASGTLGTTNSLTGLTVKDYEASQSGNDYSVTVPSTVSSVEVTIKMADQKGYVSLNNGPVKAGDATVTIPVTGSSAVAEIAVFSEDLKNSTTYKLTIQKSFEGVNLSGSLIKSFNFESAIDSAIAMTHDANKTAVSEKTDVTYSYVDGVNGGKAVSLDGTYGLKLADGAALGDKYSISFWANPTTLGGNVDPLLAAGAFNPEYWLSVVQQGRGIWSNKSGTYFEGSARTKDLVAGKWQHVTLTVDASDGATDADAKLYIDGELVSSGKVPTGIMTNTGAGIYIGVNRWDAYFNGAVDEVMLFNKALSETEVGAIAAGVVNAANTKPGASTSNGGSDTTTAKTVKKVVITKKGSSKAIKKTVKVKKGKKLKLAAKVTVSGGASKKVTWKSSNKKVATVTSKGVVKAKKKGKVKITATSKANKKKKCTITVKVA